MSQPLEFFAATERSERARDLQALAERQESGGVPHDYVGVTILKILTMIAGLFLTLVAGTTLDPQLAFVSITMIIVGTGAILIASEKIVRVFPRSVYRTRDPIFYEAPKTTVYPQISVSQSSPPSSPKGSFQASSSGHTDSSTVAGTPGNVAVGGGHDHRNTTPQGNVIPGSGVGRK